ncbi:MAG: hypothetical protein ACHQK9_05010 [Reyranellales bacterium]
MNKDDAVELQRLSIRAMETLSELLIVSKRCLSGDEYELKRRAIGSIIGKIQIDLLEPLYANHPELDDLKDNNHKNE